MSVAQTVAGIRSLRIQGAERIAAAAVLALQAELKRYRNSPQLPHKLADAHHALMNARPTEPFLRNCLNAIIHSDSFSVPELQRRIELVLQHIATADQHILAYTRAIIPKRGRIYTHCHSSTVTRALLDVAKRGYGIAVHQTETRPRYQGRITATELARAKVPVSHYVDSAMRLALKQSDIALLGADAITADGKVVNKVGSELAAETAFRYGIPLYICTNSWKFDPATVHGLREPIEERAATEVWEKAPKGVTVMNPAFERIHPRWIKGIVSELGIHTPKQFVREVQERYPLLQS